MMDGWEINKLKEVCTKITDGSHNPPKGLESSNYIMLSSKNVLNDIIHYQKPRYLSKEDFLQENKRTQVSYDDVLLTIVGTIGRVAVVPKEHRNFTLQRSVAVLKTDKEKIYSRFLMFSLQNILDYLTSESRGVAQKGIYLKQLRELEIPIPPIQEQKQIVAILDQAFTAIDQAKANIEKNIVNAKELFQSKLNAIFSQRGDGWEENSIDEISTVVNGYSFKSKDFSVDNKIKSIKITNVGIMEFVEDSSNNLPMSFLQEYSKVQVHEGDLVLALTRTIISDGLKVARVPESYHNSLLNQRVAAIVPNLSLVNSDYLYYYFSSDIVYNYVLSNVNTLMQPNLSIKDLKRMTIPITSLEGQRRISIQIEGLSEKTNFLISNYEVKLNNIEELKKSILQKAFSGELTQKEVVV
jgi:type I restriction enzyme S subunit